MIFENNGTIRIDEGLAFVGTHPILSQFNAQA